jgi:hypothetical protein
VASTKTGGGFRPFGATILPKVPVEGCKSMQIKVLVSRYLTLAADILVWLTVGLLLVKLIWGSFKSDDLLAIFILSLILRTVNRPDFPGGRIV